MSIIYLCKAMCYRLVLHSQEHVKYINIGCIQAYLLATFEQVIEWSNFVGCGK